ncbi:unnamed protein product [Trifolium pratense]|uniref:Uncharacterized protein n=1 Tax=Trifolium pratense TaxID=57577 RepID=A0ACB0I875_TRIPR|nr:unnamed protein product [Trifolium pratense]
MSERKERWEIILTFFEKHKRLMRREDTSHHQQQKNRYRKEGERVGEDYSKEKSMKTEGHPYERHTK